MTTELVIEISSYLDRDIIGIYNSMGFNMSKKNLLESYKKYLPCNTKVGSGGSHIWISGKYNERLAIIYFK